jgi:hypothetical protein
VRGPLRSALTRLEDAEAFVARGFDRPHPAPRHAAAQLLARLTTDLNRHSHPAITTNAAAARSGASLLNFGHDSTLLPLLSLIGLIEQQPAPLTNDGKVLDRGSNYSAVNTTGPPHEAGFGLGTDSGHSGATALCPFGSGLLIALTALGAVRLQYNGVLARLFAGAGAWEACVEAFATGAAAACA